MQQLTISVGSITHAIKGRDLLRKLGIKAHIERKTNTDDGVGCGYVIVSKGNRQQIVNALNNYGIKILDISSF